MKGSGKCSNITADYFKLMTQASSPNQIKKHCKRAQVFLCAAAAVEKFRKKNIFDYGFNLPQVMLNYGFRR